MEMVLILRAGSLLRLVFIDLAERLQTPSAYSLITNGREHQALLERVD